MLYNFRVNQELFVWKYDGSIQGKHKNSTRTGYVKLSRILVKKHQL